MINQFSHFASYFTLQRVKKFVPSCFLQDDELVMSRNYEPGSLTQQKFDMLGTRTAVKKAHNDYVNQRRNQHGKSKKRKLKNTEVKCYLFHKLALAEAHATKIQNEGACKLPKPRLVMVDRDPTKQYQPPCTLLHQCSDQTGCCYSLAKTCVPNQWRRSSCCSA